MKIHVKRFISMLQRTKGCTQAKSFDDEASQYLYDHYLTPFLNGEYPRIGDLDFSQFTAEDVRDFGRYLDFSSRTNAELVSFLNVFVNTEPVAQLRRAFC